jgi:hypothetical protein
MGNTSLNLFEGIDDFNQAPSHEEMIELTVSGIDELGSYTGKRPTQCFTMKMPFPLYLRFKKLTQDCQKLAPEEKKDLYTMTACVTSLTEHIGIPALEKIIEDLKAQRAAGTAA